MDFYIMDKQKLKSGMIVELYNSEKFLVCDNKLLSYKECISLNLYSDDLVHEISEEYNINKVFIKNDNFSWVLDKMFFEKAFLTKIWERQEKLLCFHCNENAYILGYKKEEIKTEGKYGKVDKLVITYVCKNCKRVFTKDYYSYNNIGFTFV